MNVFVHDRTNMSAKMKELFKYLALALVLTGCGGQGGHLVGVMNRPAWYQEDPYGTVYVPMGSFQMGPSDQQVPFAMNQRTQTVSVQAFYMDQTEISNNEYRQFVYYVRDSIAKRRLASEGIGEHARYENRYGEEVDPPILRWDEPIAWKTIEVREALNFMFFPPHEQVRRRRALDTRELMYRYYWINFEAASNKAGRDLDLGRANKIGQKHAIRGHTDRSQFIVEEVINVYPDTLCWVRDFTYSFNEPMTRNYFWHPAYDDYPVVGLTWGQCKAFNIWRTRKLNIYRRSRGLTFVRNFRLPTEAEWEYAARGGLDGSPYPWGGPYIRNRKGCFLGNFKPMRGDYRVDGGFHTVKVYAYSPNDYGLYCMAGNVAEWTSTAYDPTVTDMSHDLNPEYTYRAKENDPPALKRKIIRGGSWKDIGYYLQNGSKTYEYMDTAKSYIGFRSVMTYLGRAKGDDL
jgi:formylglycine-generating enzyme required for sulfatase activity